MNSSVFLLDGKDRSVEAFWVEAEFGDPFSGHLMIFNVNVSFQCLRDQVLLLAAVLVISGYVHWLNDYALIVLNTNDIGVFDEKSCYVHRSWGERGGLCLCFFKASCSKDWILTWSFVIGWLVMDWTPYTGFESVSCFRVSDGK